jgi:hypothetical protein
VRPLFIDRSDDHSFCGSVLFCRLTHVVLYHFDTQHLCNRDMSSPLSSVVPQKTLEVHYYYYSLYCSTLRILREKDWLSFSMPASLVVLFENDRDLVIIGKKDRHLFFCTTTPLPQLAFDAVFDLPETQRIQRRHDQCPSVTQALPSSLV